VNLKIPILTYHSIDDSGSVISTSPEKFISQMQTLKDRGYEVIPLENLVKSLRKSRSHTLKTVVLTFDDGFRNFYHSAYPVLHEFGYKATVFLVPGYLGKSSEWNAGLGGLPVLDLLNWNQVKELSEDGIDFGAHTVSHFDCSQLPLDIARHEIINSKLIIQEQLDKKVLFFSYPFGGLNRKTKHIVQKEFYGACSTIFDFVHANTDIYQLPRIDMFYFSNNSLFDYIGTSLFSLYVAIRAALRSIRMKSIMKLISQEN
jgi:peptidoglycan/xylan/chitin deacetylase (PgdA/CDA1 family)